MIELLEKLCEASEDVVYAELRGMRDDEKRASEDFDNVWGNVVEELTRIQTDRDELIKTLQNLVSTSEVNERQLNDCLMTGDYGESSSLCDARALLDRLS